MCVWNRILRNSQLPAMHCQCSWAAMHSYFVLRAVIWSSDWPTVTESFVLEQRLTNTCLVLPAGASWWGVSETIENIDSAMENHRFDDFHRSRNVRWSDFRFGAATDQHLLSLSWAAMHRYFILRAVTWSSDWPTLTECVPGQRLTNTDWVLRAGAAETALQKL